MSESRADGATATWTAPRCPFAIEYALRPLDDIRLAIIDAFFSLPRGGAEIGGILLGQYQNRRLLINDSLALQCEHAFGPGFTLSAQDRARLEALLTSASLNPSDRRPVGWYHSHTRSEIFLSDADLEIHNRYFPEPFQVALVLRPHTFQPTRAGFFFRDASGAIDAAAGGHEFVLETLPLPPLPTPVPRHEPSPSSPVIAEPAPAPGSPAPLTPPQEPPAAAGLPTPKFLDVAPTAPWTQSGRWLGLLLLVAVGVGMAVAYQTRHLRIPRLSALYTKVAAAPTLGLNTLDSQGQLQIRWDRNSSILRRAANAILSIADGTARHVIPLDATHLQTGVFTYARQAERVDVAMTVLSSGGRTFRQATTFLGAPPPPLPAAADDLRNQRDTLLQQNAKLTRDLHRETIQVKKLQRSVADLRDQLQHERQRRLGNQNPVSGK